MDGLDALDGLGIDKPEAPPPPPTPPPPPPPLRKRDKVAKFVKGTFKRIRSIKLEEGELPQQSRDPPTRILMEEGIEGLETLERLLRVRGGGALVTRSSLPRMMAGKAASTQSIVDAADATIAADNAKIQALEAELSKLDSELAALESPDATISPPTSPSPPGFRTRRRLLEPSVDGPLPSNAAAAPPAAAVVTGVAAKR